MVVERSLQCVGPLYITISLYIISLIVGVGGCGLVTYSPSENTYVFSKMENRLPKYIQFFENSFYIVVYIGYRNRLLGWVIGTGY